MLCLSPVSAWLAGVNHTTGKRLLSFRQRYYKPDLLLPCGKCMACIANKCRSWRLRLQLENTCHTKSTYITLTYNNDNLPSNNQPCKKHIQNFLKRFRNVNRDYNINLSKIRYFIASEHGDKYGRVHYHGVLFGVDLFQPCWLPYLLKIQNGFPIYSSQILEDIWSHGFVSFDKVTDKSIAYIANYIYNQSTDICLHSLGLGRSVFVDTYGRSPVSLSSTCLQIVDNGFITLPVRYGYKPFQVGSLADRYIERFDRPLYEQIKQKRRNFIISQLPAISSDVEFRYLDTTRFLQHQTEQLKERLLHNGKTPICYS